VETPCKAARKTDPAGRFRVSVLAAMMVFVSAVTGVVLSIAERKAQTSNEEELQQKFQSKIAYELGLDEGRQSAVEVRCKLLARSVRIRAALQEDDVKDLYDNAIVEMPDAPNIVRFLNSAGAVLSPKADDPGVELLPWEKALEPLGSKADEQQKGYVVLPIKNVATSLNEVISTPVIDAGNGERLGTMVLGFTPTEFDSRTVDEIEGGIVTGGQLYTAPGMRAGIAAKLGAAVLPQLRGITGDMGSFHANIGDAPHLVFYRVLNPGSALEKAYQVCVYPLAESLAQQALLREQILGAGFIILLLGLAGSHFISLRLARPVEEIAADSVAQAAGRVVAEAALELTEQKYRGIFENAAEGIFVLGADYRWISVNPAMAEIFGYETAEELMESWNKADTNVYVDESRQRDFLECVTRDGAAARWEVEMQRRDGKMVWASQSARAVRGADGELLHLEGTLVDVTDRKRAADELKGVNQALEQTLATLQATQQQVIQQERLRALGQMASGIAHDFNNALMPISGFSELLLSQPDTDEPTRLQYLEMILTAAQDAGSVVGRLREFYRPNEHSDVFASVTLSRVAKQAVTMTRPKWKDQAQAKGTDITVHLQLEDKLPVKADESALRELLTNLIFNAVDAMPQGGPLTVRTYCEAESGVIEIIDSGTGMTEEVRKHCLEPFYSTKGEGGTGLGLAMVFGIVQRHGGTVDIESEVGKGTTFIIRLPLQRENEASGANTGQGDGAQGLSILLVDDEPQVREVLSALLNAEGHQCETAGLAADGIQLFRDGHFDIVIADKAMPGMSGDQMAVSIKQMSPSMPFVLLTGFGSFLNSEDMPGVDVVASKPITCTGLREAIGKALKAA
jgi:PAS domain S-box-containing protein